MCPRNMVGKSGVSYMEKGFVQDLRASRFCAVWKRRAAHVPRSRKVRGKDPQGKIRISGISGLRGGITRGPYDRLFPLARHQRAIVISIRRETTAGEHRGSLRAPMRVRRCLVNRTKCGERIRLALIAERKLALGFPRGLDRRRHGQIGGRRNPIIAPTTTSN